MHEPCSKRRIEHVNQYAEDRRMHKSLQRRSVHKAWSKEETMQQGRMTNQSLKGWGSVQKAWCKMRMLCRWMCKSKVAIARSVVQYHGRCPSICDISLRQVYRSFSKYNYQRV
eukprot:scaffold158_cov103-Skeletonema_dohrnii-CCMP3373.AAC.2